MFAVKILEHASNAQIKITMILYPITQSQQLFTLWYSVCLAYTLFLNVFHIKTYISSIFWKTINIWQHWVHVLAGQQLTGAEKQQPLLGRGGRVHFIGLSTHHSHFFFFFFLHLVIFIHLLFSCPGGHLSFLSFGYFILFYLFFLF